MSKLLPRLDNLVASPVHSSYEIVLAEALHLAAIPAIELSASSMFRQADLPLKIRYRVTDKETLRVAQREGRIWIATRHHTEAVGFALISLLDGSAHLDEVGVLPAHGRNGIGTCLVQTAVSWAAAQGHTMLTLVTFRHLPWNAPFYASLGFTAVAAEALGEEMQQLLAEEQAAGISIKSRQVMVKQLS